ncbi:hypothetical protein QVD17_02627 [Tagetes erecta]|uniref:RanBD1 domain-containing protein n=1 Tax=Tagetes erecta TaxID=13708 RepID=A0AAD8L9L3_TARER|nr:hypothetical protein QVD17_02627 [Tagetes erecta]
MKCRDFFRSFAMGDAENTFPSKKRVASTDLSGENLGLDDDGEECPGQEETCTLKRASDEVLANRRIVKVKRDRTLSTPSTPSSNSFAAISLVPLADYSPAIVPINSFQETEKTDFEKFVGNDESTLVFDKENNDALEENDKNIHVSEKENLEKKDVVAVNDENTLATAKVKYDNIEKLECKDEDTPGAEKERVVKRENLERNDQNTPTVGSVNSFQQLSSSQNAFTGLVGTGFSSSSFSFESILKSELAAFPSFSFGTNGNSSLFGDMDKKIDGSRTIPSFNKNAQVETGEENEKTIFTTESLLYEFVDGGWKERGKGELKVNVSTSGTRKARLIMRAKGNYRLILNASIFVDMKLTNMEKKGITFACLNSTGEGQNGLSTFALKFKDASIVDEFRSVVMAHKGNLTPPVDLITPENTPKAHI